MTFMVNKQHQFTLLHDFSMEIQEILTELAAIYHTSQLLQTVFKLKGKSTNVIYYYQLIAVNR